MSAGPVWDIAARRTLHRRGARFELDVAFRSTASRIVLFGPSGAGKTQTLRMISGTADPDRGHIAIAGRTLFDSTRGIRLTPQAQDCRAN